MNEILAGIYGTHGQEKVASEGGDAIATLSDLALALIAESISEEDAQDHEKVASAHESVLEQLSFYDVAGRAVAHAEFQEMEKMAAEGDTSALEAFFEDVAPPEPTPAEIKAAALAELARRKR